MRVHHDDRTVSPVVTRRRLRGRLTSPEPLCTRRVGPVGDRDCVQRRQSPAEAPNVKYE